MVTEHLVQSDPEFLEVKITTKLKEADAASPRCRARLSCLSAVKGGNIKRTYQTDLTYPLVWIKISSLV